jgi:hypothetical protein
MSTTVRNGQVRQVRRNTISSSQPSLSMLPSSHAGGSADLEDVVDDLRPAEMTGRNSIRYTDSVVDIVLWPTR